MKSPYIDKLRKTIEKNRLNAIKELEKLLSESADDAELSDADRLRGKQLYYAIMVIATITRGMGPDRASGPTDQDKEWATQYFIAHRSGRVRPAHFDAEIEDLIQHVAV